MAFPTPAAATTVTSDLTSAAPDSFPALVPAVFAAGFIIPLICPDMPDASGMPLLLKEGICI